MRYPLAELINLSQLQQLITLFTGATGLTVSVVDLDGNIVVASEYQSACREFHRFCLPSSQNCQQFISQLTIQAVQNKGWTMTTCANGLVEAALPLILEGTHIATLLAGQFLLAPPDLEAFRRQAREHAFDEEKYLEAIRQIPVVQHDRMEKILLYLGAVAEVVGKIALEKLHRFEQVNSELLASEEKFRTLAESTSALIYILQGERVAYANPALQRLSGFSWKELSRKKFWELVHPDDYQMVKKLGLKRQQRDFLPDRYELRLITKSGETRWIDLTARYYSFQGKPAALASAFDITERKAMEDEISRQREALSLFLEHSPAGTAIIDAQGTIVYLNARAQKFTGYSLEDIPTMDAWLRLAYPDPQYRQQIMDNWYQQLAEKGTARGLVRARGKDGEWHYLDFYGVTLVNEQTVVSIWDITWQKRVEEELRISEARFRALTDASFEGIIISENGIVIEANQRAGEICGYKPQDLVGRHFSNLSAPESLEIIKSHLDSRVELPYEATVLRPDGARIPVEIQGRMFTYKNRQVRASAIRDLSERKKSQEEIDKKNRNLQALFFNTPDAVAMGDSNQIIVDVNPRFSALFGYSREECIGSNLTDLLLTDEYYAEYQEHLHLTKMGLSVTGETQRRNKSGQLIDVFVKVIPIANYGYYVIYSDISKRKAAEKTIQSQLRELEAKNAEMERFTYTVSHDLRSPLITIKGFAGLMLEDLHNRNVDQQQVDLMRIINAADKMDQLLRDLLELSRVGRLLNPFTRFPLYEAASEAAELLTGRLQERAVRLNIAADLPVVWADKARIREVFQNLLENAIKFMGDNSALIEVGWEQGATEKVFFVRDNGIGIDSRYLEKIFGLFDQLDPHSEGTGIGLALVKRIIEFHEGRIWVESPGPGQGACFYFTLPEKKKRREEQN